MHSLVTNHAEKSHFSITDTVNQFAHDLEKGFSPLQKDAYEGMSCKTGAAHRGNGHDLVRRSILPALELHGN